MLHKAARSFEELKSADHPTAELQKSKATYQDALNERRLLEKQHVDASIVTQNLVNELARAESETLRVTENLQATEKASAYAEFEA